MIAIFWLLFGAAMVIIPLLTAIRDGRKNLTMGESLATAIGLLSIAASPFMLFLR